MNPRASLLVQALARPADCLAWPLHQWELLMQQARRANLMARLEVAFERAGVHAQLPVGPRKHFDSIRRVADSQVRAVRWEARQIAAALQDMPGMPVVMLKGAAYVLAELPVAQGRLFSDVDILVPRERVPGVESSLMAAGWQNSHHDAYDQRYYREWMHEIPPMQHALRETVIDVHHNILPLSGRIRLDAGLLLAAAQPLAAWPGLSRLGDADLVLHSACHLFLDGEFDKGLRDLVDLDALLRHFGGHAEFWPSLQQRARELGVGRVLFYALRYTALILQTPVPQQAHQALQDLAPNALVLRLMDAVFIRALQPDHPSCESAGTGAARRWLYLRAHWMRMPLHLLLPHLIRKTFKRDPDDEVVVQAKT
ncbi:nucleotidyltransferase domain-containing protein [Roseateles koreensis]|uniref:Nucleotidyltransferase family protein n=1 Tax=Roseateles koreensis TaxID=2987526 RepID=A0ABT5KR19_9BURK|nr:nucleotidyltransferase family protein [Roseateles koreensis]MDC8784910.1 nucleotidyltransferase family protein [Roseateles koreensis]